MAWQEKLAAFNNRLTIRHRLMIAAALAAGWLISLVAFEGSTAVFLLAAALVVLQGILPLLPARKRSSRRASRR